MPNILVCLENDDGQLSESSFELLAVARGLADARGVQVEALVTGPLAPGALANLGAADMCFRLTTTVLPPTCPKLNCVL